MKAYVLHGVNDIRYEETASPLLKEDEVLLEVGAVGICGSDIPRIYQTGAHRHPLIPGHEFSGRVVETGAGCDNAWLGRRVGVFPLIPCGECISCKNKQYEMCQNYSYLGSRTDGGFAEYVAVPKKNLIELTDNVSYEAAAMLEPMAVAVHAIKRMFSLDGITDIETLSGEIREKSVAVLGLGTIGLLIVMFLKQMGMKNVLVIGNKDFQKEQALRLGIGENNYCNKKVCDVASWIKQKTSGNGANYLFECVGKNETINLVLDSAAAAANIVLLGNPYSDMAFDKQTYWKILRSQLKITGTWNSSFTHEENDDWHYVVNLLNKRKIEPEKLISHRLKLSELPLGLEIMKNKTEDYVKIIINPGKK